ncbi:MAG: OmpH family outer membrane protein [Thermodesulfobacteriota bacterium]|nr:OmpH family outer membrane protein [Thermodesulfobacteriota bacterium]
MKKVISLLIVVSFILAGVCSAGAEKIGFINIKNIIVNSDAGKAAGLDLKKFVEKKKAQIQEKEGILKKTKTDLEKQRAVITASAYKKKELAYQKSYRDYKRFIEDANEEMKLKEQQFSQKLIPEVFKIANSIGKKGGYTCIMDVSTNGLIFHSKANNITTKVIEQYNREYKSRK